MGKSEKLSGKWQEIVANSEKDGIVLFSLGTVANTSGMPFEYKVSNLAGNLKCLFC